MRKAFLVLIFILLALVVQAGVKEHYKIEYCSASEIVYVPLNNTYAIVAVTLTNNGTFVTIYENGRSASIYCGALTFNVSEEKVPYIFSNIVNANNNASITHFITKLGENLPRIGIFAYNDCIAIELHARHYKFHVFNQELDLTNEFTLNSTSNFLGIVRNYLIFYNGKVSYENITINGESLIEFLCPFLTTLCALGNRTEITVPEISNVTLSMYNMLNGSVKEIHLKDVVIREYPSLILGNAPRLDSICRCFVLNDFIFGKILDLETLCYSNNSVQDRFYIINLCNGEVNLSPKFSGQYFIKQENNIIIAEELLPIYKILYLYSPNFTYLGTTKVCYVCVSFLSGPINLTENLVTILIPIYSISKICSPYATVKNYVCYDGYVYVTHGDCVLIIHNNEVTKFKDSALFFSGKPVIVEHEMKGFKLMELNGDKIVKCVFINAENYTTRNIIAVTRGENITCYKNITESYGITHISYSGIGNFLVFNKNGTNVVVTLPNFCVIKLAGSCIIGVYNGTPILFNKEYLQAYCNYPTANCYNLTIGNTSVRYSSTFFLIPIFVLIIILGIIELRRFMR
ncbi:hypothetical protein [Acidianus sp. HS-5]|uniref:hypothetical protein n=1 Tax=Acidianus sp. HS-5 TaxID=2886040 RepID=UPI001F41C1E4|nr:hypothetical protein [Acidianus sp. HS-5]BDC18783.1 hypothetical protein HS5_16730 [Acidianus sp. HS-5]